jgi:putative methionine-R-sulfoxide reductase with GAF domain
MVLSDMINNLDNPPLSREPSPPQEAPRHSHQLHSQSANQKPQREELLQEIDRMRRIETTWRELAAQYVAMIEAFDGLLYICSSSYEIEFMNRKLIERTGHLAMGEKCYQVLHNRKRKCPWCVNERVFQGATVRWEILSPKDHRWYYVVNTPIHYPDGRVYKMAMIQDITARKEAEEKLYRNTRTLKALTECSSTLVRARNEAGFIKDLCRIIVDTGGYRLAWVGFAETDKMKSVRPVGYAGFEKGYLETLKISWADTKRGRGPTGTAIRTGRPCICQNMLTDSKFAPWSAQARKRGYASSIALPLKAEGGIFGALNIYAQEPKAFDAEEVKLLQQLADDLAFGLSVLRLRQADLSEGNRQHTKP